MIKKGNIELTTISPSRSFRKAPTPLFLNDPCPQTILPLLEEEEVAQELCENVDEDRELRTTLILRHALQWGIERGDIELVNWLVSLNGRWVSLVFKLINGRGPSVANVVTVVLAKYTRP